MASTLLRLKDQMSPDPSERQGYDVSLDETAIKWVQLGPLFARYSVPLRGAFDRAWIDCYRRASSESAEFSRFQLEAERRTVTFSCRADDGPAKIQAALKRLEMLVTFVNQRAGSSAPVSHVASS
ncbi:MAG TPA: hypothetical protein VF376_06880 [Thermoanaerobaculia bacterium]